MIRLYSQAEYFHIADKGSKLTVVMEIHDHSEKTGEVSGIDEVHHVHLPLYKTCE
mgnify:CR=1 FL=1